MTLTLYKEGAGGAGGGSRAGHRKG
jgi:hypothetical protein